MKNIIFTFHNDWKQIGQKFNWYTAHILEIYFENEPYTGGIELRVMLLGLGFVIRYNYNWENSEVGKVVEEHLKEHKSDCCGAEVKDVCADEGTCHWECMKCGEACNDTYYSPLCTICKKPNHNRLSDLCTNCLENE